jgi:hypothetical protein
VRVVFVILAGVTRRAAYVPKRLEVVEKEDGMKFPEF